MLRPHLGVAFLLGDVRLGTEVSRVRFPNGGIDSTQAALTLGFTSPHLWVPEGGRGPVFEGPVAWLGRGLEFEVRRLEHLTSARTRLDADQLPFDIAGISVTHDFRDSWFRFLSFAGAARGSSPGYAQVLAGLGLRTSPVAMFGLEARLGAGLGGGGDVDTGGGLIVSGEAAATLGQAGWKASAGLGFLRAPGGQFDSRTVTLRVSRRSSAPVPGKGGEDLVTFDLADWRLGTALLIYRSAPLMNRQNSEVRLMTLRADRELVRGFYLSGEAGSATSGSGVGGYSTGLAGLGWETPRWACQRLFTEAAIGAGGGGNIRSGGGLLASLRAGWRLELPRGLGLDATAGKTRAPHGDLDTTAYGLGLHVRFKALER